MVLARTSDGLFYGNSRGWHKHEHTRTANGRRRHYPMDKTQVIKTEHTEYLKLLFGVFILPCATTSVAIAVIYIKNVQSVYIEDIYKSVSHCRDFFLFHIDTISFLFSHLDVIECTHTHIYIYIYIYIHIPTMIFMATHFATSCCNCVILSPLVGALTFILTWRCWRFHEQSHHVPNVT